MKTNRINFVPVWYIDGLILKGWVEEKEFKSGCEDVTIYVFDHLLDFQERNDYRNLCCYTHTISRKRIYIFTEKPTIEQFVLRMANLGYEKEKINWHDFKEKMQGDMFVMGSENKYVPDETYVGLFKND